MINEEGEEASVKEWYNLPLHYSGTSRASSLTNIRTTFGTVRPPDAPTRATTVVSVNDHVPVISVLSPSISICNSRLHLITGSSRGSDYIDGTMAGFDDSQTIIQVMIVLGA
jgi:hypothetical protein